VVVPLQAELLAARHAAAAYHQMVLHSKEKCKIPMKYYGSQILE
jgi:hypothetical protein